MVSPARVSMRFRKGPWNEAEDNMLLQNVRQHGASNWVKISQSLESRTPKQCRERYHQNLKPGLNNDPISAEEGAIIEKMVAERGHRWAEIARELGNRSDNAVKNWWNGGMNKRKRTKTRHDDDDRRVNPIHASQGPPYATYYPVADTSMHTMRYQHPYAAPVQFHLRSAGHMNQPCAPPLLSSHQVYHNASGYGNPLHQSGVIQQQQHPNHQVWRQQQPQAQPQPQLQQHPQYPLRSQYTTSSWMSSTPSLTSDSTASPNHSLDSPSREQRPLPPAFDISNDGNRPTAMEQHTHYLHGSSYPPTNELPTYAPSEQSSYYPHDPQQQPDSHNQPSSYPQSSSYNQHSSASSSYNQPSSFNQPSSYSSEALYCQDNVPTGHHLPIKQPGLPSPESKRNHKVMNVSNLLNEQSNGQVRTH